MISLDCIATKKKKKKNPCLIRGGSCNFQLSFRGGSVRFVPKGGDGPCVFIHHISKCSGPPHPILCFETQEEQRPGFLFGQIIASCRSHVKLQCFFPPPCHT